VAAAHGLQPLSEMESVTETNASRPWRWWGAAAGVVFAAADTTMLAWFGVDFALNGRDVTVLVAAYFASSFAIFGGLIGYVVEARARDRRAAAVIRSQLEAIGAARVRLAQSEKLAALGQLAAAIAHEVRTPLAVIRSAAQGLGESIAADDDEGARASSFITAEIDRLGNVIQSLLAFARPLQLRPADVATDELLDGVELLARDDCAARGVRLRRGAARGLPHVDADADLLTQVLLGLVTNAADAIAGAGEVVLDGAARDGSVELAVADSGPGVPPALRDRIFEPFFTTRSRGVGLGLAVARQIVEAHGGTIAVDAGAEGGARFVVRLPLASAGELAA
jgi:two-component system sensor histidine kinase HydH